MSTPVVEFGKRRTPDSPNGTAPYSQFREDQAEREREAINEAKRDAKAFRVWTPEEIWKPLEEPDYLVSHLFVRGTLALIVAYGASLKTWVLEDGALSVAMGVQWMQRFDTRKSPALIVDFESGDYELRRRAHRIASGRDFPLPVEGFAFVSMPALSLTDDDFYEALEPLAADYAFIGIDSLAAGSGGIDENDARFARSLQRLKSVAAKTGSVVVVLHHSRKSSGEDTDPREMVRGSSAIFNACDIVLQMSRSKDDNGFVVRQTKARGGKSVEPFIVRVDDTASDASVVIASDMGPEQPDGGGALCKSLEKAKSQVLALLAQQKDLRSKEEVYRRIHGTKKIRVDALKEVIDRGLVVQAPEGTFRLASEVGQ